MTIWPKYIHFTPTEFEIIEDRLFGCPDAIAEALEIDRSIVESITVHYSSPKMVTLHVPKDAVPALVDAVEGSTYLIRSRQAYDDGDLKQKKFYKLRRVARSLPSTLHHNGIWPCGDVPMI